MHNFLPLTSGGITLSRLRAEAASDVHDAFIHVGDFAYDLHNDGGRRGESGITYSD